MALVALDVGVIGNEARAGEYLSGGFLCGVDPLRVTAGLAVSSVHYVLLDTTVQGQAAVGASLGKIVSLSCAVGAVRPVDERMLSATAPTDVGGDSNPYSLGAKFNVLTDGTITHGRYWAQEAGPHTFSVWDTVTQAKLASVADVAPAQGWREVALPTPLSVVAGKSYSITRGHSGAWAATFGTPNPPSLAPNLTGYIAMYSGGVDNFPSTFGGHNYHADVVFHTLSVVTANDASIAPALSVQTLVPLSASVAGAAAVIPVTLGKGVFLSSSVNGGATVTVGISLTRGFATTVEGGANLLVNLSRTLRVVIQVEGQAQIRVKGIDYGWLIPTTPSDILLPPTVETPWVLVPTEEEDMILVPTTVRG